LPTAITNLSSSARGQNLDGQRHVRRDLDPGADDLAVPLQGMPVADVQKRALDEHWQVDRDALPEAAVVHVPAVLGGRRGRDRLAAPRRDPEAAEHRGERQLAQRLEAWRRILEPSRSPL
jgi:hypothetical protein